MALGGGSWVTQNKVMPGAYVNFISAARASASLSDRGTAAVVLPLDWGDDTAVLELTQATFDQQALTALGYHSTDVALRPLRETLKNAKTLYLARVGGGEKAANEYAAAQYTGKRGNDLTLVVRENAEDASAFDVITLLGGEQVDRQTARGTTDALKDNAFVGWKSGVTLAETAGLPLTGGTSGSGDAAAYQAALAKLEPYAFNTLGCASNDPLVKNQFVSFTKRMRDDAGVKFQTVLYRMAADYEGVISVENKVTDKDAPEASLVYWVLGAEAGCVVNRDLCNRVYDGEYTVDAGYTQSELETAVRAGKLLFHRVGGDLRLLRDINTLVQYSDSKGEDFSENQIIRVLDQIGNDIAALFNKRFLGVTPNDTDGRISLWSAIVAHHRELERLRAIENFSPDDIIVEKGEQKRAVVVTDRITPVSAMQQLYMTVVVA